MNWVKVVDFFGMFNKARTWLQGKKTYLTAAIKVVTALGTLLATLGTMFGILAQALGMVAGWMDGGMSFGQLSDAITKLIQQHNILVTAFAAAWWAMWDAFSDMAKYAAASRRQTEILAAACVPQQQPTGPANSAPVNSDERRVL